MNAELIRKILVLARPYGRKKLLFVFLLSLAQGILQVLGVTSIFPFLAVAADPQRIQNSKFGQKVLAVLPQMTSQELLIVTGLIAVAMLLLSSVVNLLATYVRNRYGHSFAHWLRLRLMRQIAAQPYSYFLHHSPAIFNKKVNGDVNQYATGVLLPFLDMLAQLITIVLLGFTLFVVDPLISLGAAIIVGGFYAGVFGFLAKGRRTIQTALRAGNRGVSTHAMTFFNGIKPIKVQASEDFFVSKFEYFSRKVSKCLAILPLYTSAPRYLIEPVAFGSLVIYVVYLSASGGNLISVLPNLGVIALAGYRLIPAVQLLYNQLTQITTMRHALDEVFDEFEAAEESELPEQADPVEKSLHNTKSRYKGEVIQLKNLHFRYPGASQAVFNGLTLIINKGDAIAITGKSGAGKSTLVDLLLGLHRPDSGQIVVDGTALTPNDMAKWRATIGYVPQDIFLADDTIAANVAFGVPEEKIDPARLEEVSRLAQVYDFISNELPQGFETTVGERGVRLSGGQRQRIGLARALYRKPALLLLDEATSALDNETEIALSQAINSLQGDITLVVIAHRLSTIEKVPVKYTLVGGRLHSQITGMVKE